MAVDSNDRIEQQPTTSNLRVAVVHDWLTGMRGGERVLEVLAAMYPNMEIFTAFLDEEGISPLIRSKRIEASSANSLPGVKSYYRSLLPLYPLIASDISRRLRRRHAEKPFDVVISVSHCIAKNVRAPKGVKHFSYCLTPVRYLWDQYSAYFGGKRMEPLIRQIAKLLRVWDKRGAKHVDLFAGISCFVGERIERCYGRESLVIYPPVPTEWLQKAEQIKPQSQRSGFLVVNALVPYKNTHVVIEAFNKLGLELTIVGDGPERARLKSLAKPNIHFAGKLADEELARRYCSSQAMIFAAEEDFGMTPVEMQACGGPVIAYGKGGALETVCTQEGQESGCLFYELSADSLARSIQQFLDRSDAYTVENCIRQAELFSRSRFESDFEQALKSLGIVDTSRELKQEGFAVTEDRKRVSLG
ncbi:MAG: glycosyltransferase [Bdellovibrionales bacterium]|nr:glycosyltransferase [Bdellovibrionales bacterium]